MQEGDLLFVDYGAAESQMYTSDICRTFPVSGVFTPEQRRYYEIVLEAQDSALARISPGVMNLSAGAPRTVEAIERVMKSGR